MSGRLILRMCDCGRRLWAISAGRYAFTYCRDCDGAALEQKP